MQQHDWLADDLSSIPHRNNVCAAGQHTNLLLFARLLVKYRKKQCKLQALVNGHAPLFCARLLQNNVASVASSTKISFCDKMRYFNDVIDCKKWFTCWCSWFLLPSTTFFLKCLSENVEETFDWLSRKKKILQMGQNNIEKFSGFPKTISVVNLLRNFFACNLAWLLLQVVVLNHVKVVFTSSGEWAF